jgi:TetR/AcrR family transcriptional regulator, transcriptional repressor of bet genes
VAGAARRSPSGEVDPAVTRRAQVLCSAIQAIGRDGVDRARLRDIAEEAGVSVGLVQHYFGTRQELVEQAFDVMLRLSLDRLDRLLAADRADPLVTLLSLVRFHVYGAVDFAERWSFWIELWSGARRDPRLTEVAHRIYEHWAVPFRDTVSELQRQHRCRVDLDADDAAATLMSLIDGLAVRSLVDPRSMSLDRMEARLLRAAVFILGVDEAEARKARSEIVLPGMRDETRPLTPALVIGVLVN